MMSKAVLIDAPTQAGKTQKCFRVIREKLARMPLHHERVLILYVTQANSCSGAAQVKQRVSADKDTFRDFAIYLAEARSDSLGHHMVIGYWNARNTSKMLDIVAEESWDRIVIVHDECDSGNLRGVKDRLCFVRAVERKAKGADMMILFVTATIGNLSKSIFRIARDNIRKFSTGLVHQIVHERVVEHQFAVPMDAYVGASWFVENNPDAWKELDFITKTKMNKEEFAKHKETILMKQIYRLNDAAKELSLIVTSTRTADHARISDKLTRCGYNVIVEVNNTAGRQYKVQYLSDGMDLETWNIPFNGIYAMADRGELAEVRRGGQRHATGIYSRDDLSMPHILQAALFMNTVAQKRIRKHADPNEYLKLKAISRGISRPHDYPTEPRVALVAGHIAGRGITFQNPDIDFTCTSFCFTDTKDGMTRGAANTQRFGRACGMLGQVFQRPDRQPVMIATKGIVEAAVANERLVMQKAKEIPNGTLLCLKDFITEDEWKHIMKSVKQDNKNPSSNCGMGKLDNVDLVKLNKWMSEKNKTTISKMLKFLYKANRSVSISEFKNGINYTNSDAQFIDNIKNGGSLHSQNGQIWIMKNDYIQINPKIKKFISSTLRSL